MKMDVEIISTECIKPSSPAPASLKTHKLSFLDLHGPHPYIPLVLYCPMNQDTNLFPSDIHQIISRRLELLKQSLSETLSLFYPLAGKIRDSYFIDCNNEGIYFVEAKVKSLLSEFINHPNLCWIAKFLPDEAKWTPIPGNFVAGVQVTTFSCGGITVGVLVTHMIADGTAFSSFLKSWAVTARQNSEKSPCPLFDGSFIFPYNDAYPREVFSAPLATSPLKFGKFITKRFVFEASAIANLMAKATTLSMPNPTRVEALTALFGKCFKAVLKESFGSNKSLLLIHAVNLRRRAMPQFSEYFMGNCLWPLSLLCKDEKAELHGLVCKFKEALAKLNGDFVNSLQCDGGLLNFTEAVKLERETNYINSKDIIVFSSWCNFGFYDLDFGWGKPAWVSLVDLSVNASNCYVVTFVDTKDGRGIEAWVSSLKEDMAILERNHEFLAFATLDPCPLR